MKKILVVLVLMMILWSSHAQVASHPVSLPSSGAAVFKGAGMTYLESSDTGFPYGWKRSSYNERSFMIVKWNSLASDGKANVTECYVINYGGKGAGKWAYVTVGPNPYDVELIDMGNKKLALFINDSFDEDDILLYSLFGSIGNKSHMPRKLQGSIVTYVNDAGFSQEKVNYRATTAFGSSGNVFANIAAWLSNRGYPAI